MTPRERAERVHELLCNNDITSHDRWIDETEKAITEALAAEREACAKIADQYAVALRRDAAKARELGLDCSDSGGTLDHYAELYEGIAQAIRTGRSEGTP
jgi:acyl-CoA hydrolase